jgi:biopolymer transport protein ExbB/TolQ
MNMLEVTMILGSLLFGSVVSIIILSIKTLRLKSEIKKLATAYSKVTQLMLSNNKLDDDVHKESFIKFLSDSRDSAFVYIEEVQLGISKFVEQVDPEISYFKEYGDIMAMAPNYNSMNKIATAYEDLIKLLPKEEG